MTGNRWEQYASSSGEGLTSGRRIMDTSLSHLSAFHFRFEEAGPLLTGIPFSLLFLSARSCHPVSPAPGAREIVRPTACYADACNFLSMSAEREYCLRKLAIQGEHYERLHRPYEDIEKRSLLLCMSHVMVARARFIRRRLARHSFLLRLAPTRILERDYLLPGHVRMNC